VGVDAGQRGVTAPLRARVPTAVHSKGIRGIAVASRSLHGRATVGPLPQPKRRATYEDLMQVPDTKVAEIIDGELVVSPRPASAHARAASTLQADISGPFDRDPEGPSRPGGWYVVFEPELHLGDDVLVPDVAGWRRSRMPTQRNVPFVTLTPDWLCEVVSPSSGRVDRSREMRIYGDAGVPSLWIVDPLARTLEVYRRESDRWIVAAVRGGPMSSAPSPSTPSSSRSRAGGCPTRRVDGLATCP
jgi:Uma2 family endonuclease